MTHGAGRARGHPRRRRHAWLAGLLLSACAVASPPARAVAFDFWFAHTGAYARAIQALCDDFNASAAPDRVRCVSQGNYSQTLRKAVAAYRAGTQPALVEIYDVGTADMLLSGAIRPVDALLRAAGLPDGRAGMLPVVAGYYATRGGMLESQPFSVSTLVLYANPQKLLAAGIATPPQHWAAFARDLALLKARGEACPAVFDFSPWKLLEQTSASAGVAVASADNGHAGLAARYVFAGGPELRLLRDLGHWYAQGLIRLPAATRGGSQALAFADGECALSIDSTSASSVIARTGRVVPWVGLVPVYADRPRYSSTLGGSSLWVFKGHAPPVYRAVAHFLDYLRQPRQQARFAQATGYLPPSRQGAQALAAAGAPPVIARSIATGIASLEQPTNAYSIGIRLGFVPQFRLIWQEEIERALAGQQSMRAALERAQARGNRLLERFQATYAGVPLP